VDETTILKRSENVTFEIVAGEAILIDMHTGAYFSLNEVGTVFWEKLDGRTSITAHAAAIADEYNQKTADFITQLRQLATGDGDVAQRTQQLAEEYDVNASFIAEQLPHLAGAAAESHAAVLAEEFGVTAEMVTADLLELAGELAAEKLVEVV